MKKLRWVLAIAFLIAGVLSVIVMAVIIFAGFLGFGITIPKE